MLISLNDLCFETNIMKDSGDFDTGTLLSVENMANSLPQYAETINHWVVLRKHVKSNVFDMLCCECGQESKCGVEIHYVCPWCGAHNNQKPIEIDENYEEIED